MTETDLTDRTILITGGAGFIGSHIADALTTDNDITVLDDLSSGSRENVPGGATFIEGDVRDDDTLKNAAADADVIFHEAAIVSVQQSIDQPQRCQDVNLAGTLAVLEAARREDARVVFASSAAIYGEPTSVPIDEAEPTAPASPYGIDKCAADQYVRTYHDLYGLDTVALRYFNVYGPGQTGGDYSGVISIFREQALTGDPITVDGDGSQTRDFVHVEDIVRANLLAATTDAVGTAYNIGTGTETSIQTLAETVQSIADADSPIVHGEPRPGDIDRSCADVTRAQEQLGYEPKISLEEGLRTLF